MSISNNLKIHSHWQTLFVFFVLIVTWPFIFQLLLLVIERCKVCQWREQKKQLLHQSPNVHILSNTCMTSTLFIFVGTKLSRRFVKILGPFWMLKTSSFCNCSWALLWRLKTQFCCQKTQPLWAILWKLWDKIH